MYSTYKSLENGTFWEFLNTVELCRCTIKSSFLIFNLDVDEVEELPWIGKSKTFLIWQVFSAPPASFLFNF